MSILRRAIRLSLLLALAAGSAGGATDGALRWQFYTQGLIASSAAVAADGTLYVGSEDRRLYAIHPGGTLKWRWPAVPDGPLLVTDWFDATPTVAPDGTVYVGNFDGRLYALHPSGTLKWEFPSRATVPDSYLGFVLSSVALGEDGTLYFGAGDGAVHAVNPDGTERWSFPTGDWVDSSPAVGADGTVYVGSWDQFVYAIRPDGTLAWRVPTGEAVLSSPALGADGTVYVGSADGKLYALRRDGTVAWTFATGDAIDSSPVVAGDGTVYVGSADGYVHAVKSDGSAAWSAPFDVGQGVFGGLLLRADGTLIFGASDRAVYALHGDGTLKWKYATGDMVDAAAAVGLDGTLFIGSFDSRLHALHGNGASVATAAWPKFRRDPLNQGRASGPEPAAAPTILVPPASRSVAYGEPVTFSVGVEGSEPFSYQWIRNGADLPGATGLSLVLASATTADAGSYQVRISNAAGSVTSTAAILTVSAALPAAIVGAPRDLVLAPGARLHLWATASGSPPLTYQWFRDGVLLPGATAASYAVAASSSADAGTYRVRVSNAAGAESSDEATVRIVEGVSSRLINLSTRARVGVGDSVLIAGMVVAGTAPRPLLLRAIGPTLSRFGVADPLADPSLMVTTGSVALWSNDDWGAAPDPAAIAAASDSVSAFPLDPSSTDAAARLDLGPGRFTVVVTGAAGAEGVALVEAYELASADAAASRLINLSARGYAGTGENIMIPGFVVGGTGARTLLVRAVGPTLTVFDVDNVLPDPVLRLYDMASGAPVEILTQDDWGDGPDAAVVMASGAAVGAFALEAGSADAALLVVLMPGRYSAVAAGKSDTTGNVLVEVYDVP